MFRINLYSRKENRQSLVLRAQGWIIPFSILLYIIFNMIYLYVAFDYLLLFQKKKKTLTIHVLILDTLSMRLHTQIMYAK